MPDDTMTMTETDLPTPAAGGPQNEALRREAAASPPKSIEARLKEAAETAAAGKSAEGVKAELAPLLGKKKQAMGKHTKERREVLLDHWIKSNKSLHEVWHDITCTFGNKWLEYANKAICPTINKLKALEDAVAVLAKREEGTEEKKVNDLKEAMDGKKIVLEAWLKTEETLTERLKTVDDAIVRIRTVLPDPSQRKISLYLFLWKAFPIHWRIRPPVFPAGVAKAFDVTPHVGALICSLPSIERGVPYLIEAEGPQGLPAEIDKACGEFLDAGIAYNKALAGYKPDDLAAKTKERNETRDNLDRTIEEALKKLPDNQS